MLEFKDYKYTRPDYEKVKIEIDALVQKMNNAEKSSDALSAIKEFNATYNTVVSDISLVEIRNSIDMSDKFYEKEMNFIIEYMPKFDELKNHMNKAIVNSKFVKNIKGQYGEQFVNLLEAQIKCFDPCIMPELVLEGKVCNEYNKLISSAKIEFDGKTLNIAQMGPYLNNTDRNVRRDALDAKWKFFEENEKAFDDIYDQLVHVRDKMAKKLGYKNYIDLGYLRLGRTDYNYHDVQGYRDRIYKYIVPLVQKIRHMQSERLGIKDLKDYDLVLNYKEGNPQPFGSTEDKINNAKKMYNQMSDETGEFVNFMFDHKLTDLDAKANKNGGGYCTYIPNYKSPFVFANFNGTSGDVDVLTHEFGHAFQVFSSRKYESMENLFPTLEACEIHSMSMEFFAIPYCDLFFGENAKKYEFAHLTDSICFLPYGVSVDEFQENVYLNPDMTPKERKKLWLDIEKKYTPDKVHENEFLKEGNYWLRQSHIFTNAFYYIDYTLAQVCAHQFFIKDQDNHEKAWQDYYALCQAGGSKSFFELLKVANIGNPFKGDIVKNTAKYLENWIDNYKL